MFTASVRRAFADEGLSIDDVGPLAIKADVGPALRIDLAFVLGVAIGGLIWDAEKALLSRGIAAARSLWASSGTVTVEASAREPTIYFVPDGPEGDRALAEIDDDYEHSPPGPRMWIPNVGWIADADMIRIMEDIEPGLTEDQYRATVERMARGVRTE